MGGIFEEKLRPPSQHLCTKAAKWHAMGKHPNAMTGSAAVIFSGGGGRHFWRGFTSPVGSRSRGHPASWQKAPKDPSRVLDPTTQEEGGVVTESSSIFSISWQECRRDSPFNDNEKIEMEIPFLTFFSGFFFLTGKLRPQLYNIPEWVNCDKNRKICLNPIFFFLILFLNGENNNLPLCDFLLLTLPR